MHDLKGWKLLPEACLIAFWVLFVCDWNYTRGVVAERRPTIVDYENYYNEVYIDDADVDIKTKNALASPMQRWPSTTLHYRISSIYTDEEAEVVRGALAWFNNKTCLNFVEYDRNGTTAADDATPPKYIHFLDSEQLCGTLVGYNPMTGNAPHDVQLTYGCRKMRGVVQHEVLHVLGLYHEQSRYDRDSFVQIEYANIEPRFWSQFMQQPPLYTTTHNVPYDYMSIMHYPPNAFARDPGLPTIRARHAGVTYNREMGQLDEPSAGDLKKITIMYCNGAMQ